MNLSQKQIKIKIGKDAKYVFYKDDYFATETYLIEAWRVTLSDKVLDYKLHTGEEFAYYCPDKHFTEREVDIRGLINKSIAVRDVIPLKDTYHSRNIYEKSSRNTDIHIFVTDDDSQFVYIPEEQYKMMYPLFKEASKIELHHHEAVILRDSNDKVMALIMVCPNIRTGRYFVDLINSLRTDIEDLRAELKSLSTEQAIA